MSASPPTMTGLPRHSGWSSCSTEAKNASRSTSRIAGPSHARRSGAPLSSPFSMASVYMLAGRNTNIRLDSLASRTLPEAPSRKTAASALATFGAPPRKSNRAPSAAPMPLFRVPMDKNCGNRCFCERFRPVVVRPLHHATPLPGISRNRLSCVGAFFAHEPENLPISAIFGQRAAIFWQRGRIRGSFDAFARPGRIEKGKRPRRSPSQLTGPVKKRTPEGVRSIALWWRRCIDRTTLLSVWSMLFPSPLRAIEIPLLPPSVC